MATQAELNAAKAVKDAAAAKKAVAAEKAAAAKLKAAEKAKAAKAKAAEKAAAAKLKEKAKADKLKAKEKLAKEKADAKAAALLPVTLTAQQNDLAEQVNANQEIIVNSGNSMIMTAMDSGMKLMKLKDAVKAKKGKWEIWMDQNLDLSDRQCQKYMKLATNPKAVKDLLAEMGEDASINAITHKIGQLGLSNDEIKEREEKKEAAAAKKAEAKAESSYNFDSILVACDKMSLSDLQELKAYVQDRIDQKASEPDDSIGEEDDGESEQEVLSDLDTALS